MPCRAATSSSAAPIANEVWPAPTTVRRSTSTRPHSTSVCKRWQARRWSSSMADEVQRVLPLFPLEQVVLFPGMSLPLRIFEERYKLMIGACQVTDQLFGVVLIRSGREVGAPAEPEQVGCIARMVRIDRIPDGQMHILTIGEQRFRLVGPARIQPEGYLVGDVQLLSDPETNVDSALVATVTQEFMRYQQSM